MVSTDMHEEGDPPATKRELYSYYAFYAGNNGTGPFNYSQLLFQNLIFQAAFDPRALPLGSRRCDNDLLAPCHVHWNGGTKQYTSVLLIGNGLTFVCQTLFFLAVGGLADYGNWNRWVVRGFSVLSWAFQFAFLGARRADQWGVPIALYILSSVTWWASYIFFNAIFPKLAHDLPETRRVGSEHREGRMNDTEYERHVSLIRSRVMNYSWAWSCIGYAGSCALCVAALAGLHADDSTEANSWGYYVSVTVCTVFWVVLAMPWFLWEKRRPGPPIPKGDSYWTFGSKHIIFATKQAWQLEQTVAYMAAFFLLCDGVNTTMTLINIAQSQAVAFSAMGNSYLLMVLGFSSAFGGFGAYYVQAKLGLKTKTMLQVSNLTSLIVALWGMVGIWTSVVGYHHTWEFWAMQSVYGLSIGPQYAYGQAFLAELIPRGREYLFFGLAGIVSKGSSWIGPVACSAIVDASGNQWMVFPLVTALTLVPTIAIAFISEEKARAEAAAYLVKETQELRKVTTTASEGQASSTSQVQSLWTYEPRCSYRLLGITPCCVTSKLSAHPPTDLFCTPCGRLRVCDVGADD